MALTQVSTSGIKDGSVSTADLADGSISTAKVADDAVTADKLNNTGVTAGSYTLSSVTVDAQGRVTAASSGTPVDADKIIEGNTEVEAVDTGSDGHIKATTEGSERLRVGPAGQVGIAGANYGTTGQVLMSGGASAAPTWGDVSSSPTFEATASGAIANGDTVIVQANGTVKKPTETINLSLVAPGDGNAFSDSIFGPAAGYDSVNKKTLIIFNDENGSGNLRGKVATVDNTAASADQITYGNSFLISTNAKSPSYGGNKVVYCETAGVFLVVYNGDDNDIECRTVDVSTSTPAVGYETQINGNGYEIAAVYDPISDRVVVGYLYSNRKARVITVASGSNPSVGAEATVDSQSQNVHGSGTGWNLMVYDSSAQKVVNLYHKVNSSQSIKRGTAKVATIDTSADTISFGSAADFSSVQAKPLNVVYDPISGKILVSYADQSGNSNMYYAVGTVSGTSISFATSVQLFPSSDASDIHSFTYDPVTQVILHVYEEYTGSSSNRRLRCRTLTISGTTVTFASNAEAIFSANNNFDHFDSTYDLDQKRVLFFGRNQTNSNTGEGFSIQTGTRTSDLTTENYIGVADAAYANGATATIQVTGSVDDAQSGLTPGQSYFVQFDGSLATTPDDTSVLAGTAVAATKLLIK